MILFPKIWFLFLPILTLILALPYILSIFQHKKIKGYKNKLERNLEKKQESDYSFKNLIVTLKEKPWSRFAFPLAIFTLISIFSFFGGYINAEYSENFYVVKSNSEEYLVIEQVGDKFITVPIDLSTNEVTSEYIVIEQKSDLKNPVIFKKERLEGGIIVPSS